jgi:hypothetical protein
LDHLVDRLEENGLIVEEVFLSKIKASSDLMALDSCNEILESKMKVS